MKAEILLEWEYGIPKQDGMYFVAVKHGESAGFQEFARWENDGWALDNGGEVVAFIGVESLNQQLNIRWPDPEPKSASGSEEFEEV